SCDPIDLARTIGSAKCCCPASGAIKWKRLSCRTFAANAVRLQLHARLQSRQFLADAGDARADQGLVTDKLEGEADQNRRESREPRPLCGLPNGRGRHSTAKCSRRFCGLSGTAAAATTTASVRRSMVVRLRPTNRRSASLCQEKSPDEPL